MSITNLALKSANINIAVDIMGGDRGPHVFLYAVEKILKNYSKVSLTLCGDKASQAIFLPSLQNPRIHYEVCEQIVSMADKPSSALRTKKNSSMRKALELTKMKTAAACVSGGNTGALMATAYYVLKTLPGVSRPALATLLPSQGNNKVLLLDLGASISYDAETLYQYAVMGSILMQECEGVTQPRVALLNVGEEEIKGHSLVKHADSLIRSCNIINYIGYVEGDDIFTGISDVIVTDGFTGNVALKASEGIASFLSNEINAVCTQSFFSKLLSKLAMPLFKSLYQRMNPDQYNGASLLGLRSIVIKSHGNASPEACYFAIEQAIKEVSKSVPNKIKIKIERELMEH